ncbi:hypothetical protein QQX98_000461 [Neonectria punicea]|uniref:FAD-binding PCMH-type domain-containing protein n=1 Tax=Neonectria punicea TaxID=979145 RepID=A0ABR1HTU7_9HYPO
MKLTYLSLLAPFLTSTNAADISLQKDGVPILHNGTNCQQACETLASEFPGRLHYLGSDDSFTIWDQKQLETRYVCRVEPASADEVSKVLQVLVNNWCRFAVKCGGHSRFPDDSVSVGGVTVDLGLINNTVVSDDRTTARIGGGSLTRQIFAALDPYGLAHVGGRVGQVGVGGFTLGGGTSVLAAKYGWALDHVLEYEVVLPNATIVVASEDSHPDLYYALRGGGNNFGIVTSFNTSVFPQGTVYTGSRTFADEQTDRFLEEAEKIFTIQDAEDTNVGLEYRYTYSAQNGWTISSTQRYSEPVSNPPVNLFTTLTHYPSVELGKKGLELLKRTVERANLTSLTPQLITYSIPAATMEMSKVRGGNALGLDVEGHLVNDAVYALADDFIADFRKAAEDANAFHPFIYINYANKGQDVFLSYGKQNQQRLMEIQHEIDPHGVFTSSGLWTGFFKVR